MARFFIQFFIAVSASVLLGLTFSGTESVDEVIMSYPDHVPGAYTGGFGEQTCHSCHFSYDLNDPDGKLTIEGLGESYSPGESYSITVSVQHEDIGKGGFQMTARFEDGSQAGKFEWTNDRIMETSQADENIQYIQHSISGTTPTSENTVSWSVAWHAPDNQAGPVLFNIAANAANDDFSEFGDWIYVQEITVSSISEK